MKCYEEIENQPAKVAMTVKASVMRALGLTNRTSLWKRLHGQCKITPAEEICIYRIMKRYDCSLSSEAIESAEDLISEFEGELYNEVYF